MVLNKARAMSEIQKVKAIEGAIKVRRTFSTFHQFKSW
jgi:hypothetical protein